LSRSDAWAKIGGSQLKFTMDGISHPLDRRPRLCVADSTAGGGLKIGLSQVDSGGGRRRAAHRKVAVCSTAAISPCLTVRGAWPGKPCNRAPLIPKAFSTNWQTEGRARSEQSSGRIASNIATPLGEPRALTVLVDCAITKVQDWQHAYRR